MDFKRAQLIAIDRFDNILNFKIGDTVEVRKYTSDCWFKDKEGNLFHKKQLEFID